MMVLRVVVVLALAGCEMAPGCQDEVVQRAASPDGAHVAAVFVRNCGATTAYATSVEVLPAGTERRGAKEDVVFTADSDHGAAPAGAGGGPEVRARWLADGRLEIAHHPRARSFRRMTEHRGIHITYAPLP